MNVWLLYLLLHISGTNAAPGRLTHQELPPFQKTVRFNVYTFIVKAADTESAQTATVAAYRGSLLLTRFSQPISGRLTGAEVGDLDGNRLPELYLYSTDTNAGLAGRVRGWQFLPERLATITPVQWTTSDAGYMGLDTLWTTRQSLCRQFPVYAINNSDARPTGTNRRICYRLRPLGLNYQLLPE
jgi:hypothetical protein